MTLELALFLLPGLIIGLTLHECAHALAASWLGDRCAARQGRVSINPFRHLSFWGTLALFVLGFGWGKPVPVNLYNFRHPKRDFLLTSLSGPAANLLLCAVTLGLAHLDLPNWLGVQVRGIFLVNAMLAVFNLVPIPPLDGSRIWPCVIPGMKPVPGGKWSLIWMIVLVYILMTGKIGTIIEPVLMTVVQLLPSPKFDGQIRPDGFPLELAAPEDSHPWYWAYPIDSQDPNEFTLSFDTTESFPPERLMAFLRGNLQRQNWMLWDRDTADPNLSVPSEWKTITDKDGAGYYQWEETWYQGDRGLVQMRIIQSMPDSKDPSTPSEIYVTLALFTPSSNKYQQMIPIIQPVYPAQFEEETGTENDYKDPALP